mmetsp:Transcript_9621/g.12636  ORF Transcript_9621/g.12636 Transcript_9621/m.12636 type:complete len:83 (+) Transcript_9621:1004-1252(+)
MLCSLLQNTKYGWYLFHLLLSFTQSGGDFFVICLLETTYLVGCRNTLILCSDSGQYVVSWREIKSSIETSASENDYLWSSAC